MRIALALALIIGTVPTAAFAGNQPQPEPQRKQLCARATESAQKNQRPAKPDCRTGTRPVPPIVDPTPTFIL